MYLHDDALPSVEEIQRANEAVIAATKTAEQTASSLTATRQQLMEELEMAPMRVAIGVVVVFGLIYWTLLRR